MLARPLLCLLITIVALPMALAQESHANQNQSSSASLRSTPLKYHGGPLLTEPRGINVYLIWYGAFSTADKTSILDFFASFNIKALNPLLQPSVLTWWKTTASYKDRAQKPVSRAFRVAKRIGDPYSLGKNIRRTQVADIVKNNIQAKRLPIDSNGFYLVLTSKDTVVEKFCRNSCGFHDTVVLPNGKAVYGHVGDSGQCPGFCAWPYAVPAYGPPGPALVAPNGVSADGTIINIATVLAGAATNPYKNGYFEGNALAPLEASSACPGIFGPGAYPGYPGKLIVDASKASYNVYGANGKKFLLPAIWDLLTSACKALEI